MKAILGLCITALLLLVAPGLAAQPPGSPPPKPAEHGTLDKLPLPPDAVIVICENLKQAIGQMQPGSIILSPQRYQELIDELARLRKEAQPPARERLFSACRLVGKVRRPPAGTATREYVELRIELDFRTDAAGARVPVALRGLPLMDAKLDGAMPTWAPLDEGLALLVAEAKNHTLIVTALVPLAGTAADRKLVLEQLPTAAITTLELTVPGKVLTASAKGHGPLAVEAGADGETRLGSESLGIINQLEVAWRPELPGTTEPPVLAVTGEQRFFIDASALEADARLRLELSKGRLDEIEIRLPGEPQDLRAELLPSDERRAEPPELLSAGAPDLWRVRFKQPLTPADGPATVRLRWTQSHPGQAGTRIALSQAEVLTPKQAWQAGTVTIVLASDVAARVEADQAVRAEPREAGYAEGRGLAQSFRYGARCMSLMVRITAPATAPATEYRWNHELNVNPRRLKLTSELELTRIAGGNLEELEIKLPEGWRLDPNLIRNPFVRDVSAASADGKARIWLARQAPSPLKLRLECDLQTSGLNRAQFPLPRLVGGQSESSRPNQPVRWLRLPDRLTLTADEVVPRFEFGTSGLFDEDQRPPELDVALGPARSWQIPAPSASAAENAAEEPQLALFWQRLLPSARLDGRVFALPKLLVVEEVLELNWNGAPPGNLELACAAGLKTPPEIYLAADSGNLQRAERRPLSWRATQHNGSGELTALVIALPRNLSNPARLFIRLSAAGGLDDGAGPLTIPWLLPSPESVTPAEGSRVAVWTTLPWQPKAQSVADWSGQPPTGAEFEAGPPQLLLTSRAALRPPGIHLSKETGSGSPILTASRVLVEYRPLARDEWECRLRAQLARIRSPMARIAFDAATEGDALVTQVRVNGVPASPADFTLNPSNRCLEVRLPPESLAYGALLEVVLRIEQPGAPHTGMRWHLPVIGLDGAAAIQAVRYRVCGLSGRVLLWSSPWARQEQRGVWGAWSVPQPVHNSAAASSWIDPERAGELDGFDEAAYSFAANGAPERLSVWHAARTTVAILGSLGFLSAGVLLLVLPRGAAAAVAVAAVGVAVLLGLQWPQLVTAVFALGWPGLAAACALGVWEAWRRRRQRLARLTPTFLRAADLPRRLPAAAGQSGGA
jgi:hypothetical protein